MRNTKAAQAPTTIPNRKRATLTVAKSAKSPSPEPVAAPAPKRPTKQAQVIALLERFEGVSLDAIVAATGWQPHTVRAALSGLRKAGHNISNDKVGATRIYRIANAVTLVADAATAPVVPSEEGASS